MSEKIIKKYEVEAPNGDIIKILYQPKYCAGTGLIDNDGNKFSYRVDSFEFHGKISETGFHSNMIPVDFDYNPTEKETVAYIKEKIEEFTNQKYGEPAQANLF